MRLASSAVENSRIRMRCVSSTLATRAASAPATGLGLGVHFAGYIAAA
jgi:hypothetical protein